MGHQARRLSRHLPAGLLVLREQDSNLRPPDQQSGALPTELSRTDETGQSPKETGPLERHVPSAQRVVARDAEAGGLLSEPCRRPECTWTRAGIKPAAAAVSCETCAPASSQAHDTNPGERPTCSRVARAALEQTRTQFPGWCELSLLALGRPGQVANPGPRADLAPALLAHQRPFRL